MSDDDYTPSTDEVRINHIGTLPELGLMTAYQRRRMEEFDRWLESVRAEERERIARNIDLAADESPAYSEGLRRAARIAREGA